jgi:D-sedoheptulose 7-phosphate isomerase
MSHAPRATTALSSAAIAGSLRDRARAFAALADDHAAELAEFVESLTAVIRRGGKLLLAGNGGSAAECQHFAAELIVRYRANRRPLPALALTTDSSALTACGNDFSFADLFARQVDALGAEGDGLVLLSTSGKSPNLLRAAEAAGRVGVEIFGLVGNGGGPLAPLCDHVFVVPGDDTAVTQEIQLAVIHLACTAIDDWAIGSHG